LIEIKTQAKKAISMSRKFWENPAVELSYLYEMKSFSDQIKAVYNESLLKWPNNSRFAEDYSHFLVEGVTDFIIALKIKNRASLIEQGKNFVIDLSFRSFVRTFPAYLKKGIVNIKGRFINETAKRLKGSRNSNNGSISSTSSSFISRQSNLSSFNSLSSFSFNIDND
jgi:hypothetical protein